MQPVLHTLNAVRVLAEYCIVSYHIYFGHPVSVPENYDIGDIILSHGVSLDLMSLFFVLSGFVSMYNNLDETLDWDNQFKTQFILKRLKKTYPCYLLSLLMGLPHFLVSYFSDKTSCIYDIVAVFCQLFCLQCWLGYRFAGSNSVSWYIGTLVWIWILFPFIRLNKILCHRPWCWVIIFYLLSIASNVAFANYCSANTRQMPIIRVFEFLIGCATACTLDEANKINGVWVALCMVAYFVYACLTTAYSNVWKIEHDPYQCVLWQSISKDFRVAPGTFLTLTSVAWAMLFHWLATQELNNTPHIVVKVLSFDFFKSLSLYSLQLYLFHLPINDFIQGFFKICGAHMWLSKDIIMVMCYSFSYAIYVYVQPWLDRLVCLTKT